MNDSASRTGPTPRERRNKQNEAPADTPPSDRPASPPPGPADTEGAPVDELDVDGDGARNA